MIANFHNESILPRRKNILSQGIADIIAEKGISLLDVGCGDGEITEKVAAATSATRVEGVETRLRPACLIPVAIYDGTSLPYPDKSFDYVIICDVLHHDPNPEVILRECARVAAKGVVIKDHLSESLLDQAKLRMMDWVGNFHHNVRLEYNYLGREEWTRIFERCGLTETARTETIALYTGIFQSIFGKGLHFINRLEPRFS